MLTSLSRYRSSQTTIVSTLPKHPFGYAAPHHTSVLISTAAKGVELSGLRARHTEARAPARRCLRATPHAPDRRRYHPFLAPLKTGPVGHPFHRPRAQHKSTHNQRSLPPFQKAYRPAHPSASCAPLPTDQLVDSRYDVLPEKCPRIHPPKDLDQTRKQSLDIIAAAHRAAELRRENDIPAHNISLDVANRISSNTRPCGAVLTLRSGQKPPRGVLSPCLRPVRISAIPLQSRLPTCRSRWKPPI